MSIRERHRKEFEEAGVEAVRKRALQSLYSDEKLRHARDWLYDKDNGAARSAENVDAAIAIVTIVTAVTAVAVAVFILLGWKAF
jgi:hypothetical protein